MTEDLQGQLLYHYTSAEGLLGIVRTTTLWASDALFLNDASELTFAKDVLLVLGDERVRGGADSEAWEELREQIVSYFPDSGDARLPGDGSVYVTSFSTDPDSLNMWQGYSRKGGFAVGFSTDDILTGLAVGGFSPESGSRFDLTPDEWQQFWGDNFQLTGSFRAVRYGEGEARAGLAATVDAIFSGSGEIDVWRVLEELACFKHEAFRVEREVRLIVRVPSCIGPRPDVRSARGHLVPYERVRFPHGALREIRIGPGPYAKRSERALQHYLATPRGEWSQVAISASGIPFIP